VSVAELKFLTGIWAGLDFCCCQNLFYCYSALVCWNQGQNLCCHM